MYAIVTNGSDLFYATENTSIDYVKKLIKLKSKQDSFQTIEDVMILKEKYTVCTQNINKYDMKIYILISSNDYMKPIYDASKTIILFGFFVLFLMLFIVYIISYNLNKPIQQLMLNGTLISPRTSLYNVSSEIKSTSSLDISRL